jgi:threonine dehydrogenase-like Zn-dependent dehydrogenase
VGEGVDQGLIGQRCVAENVLADGGEVGFEHPGGYGLYFLTEAANVRLLPPDYPPDQAALIEPLAVCVRALKRLRIMGEGQAAPPDALILGDGPIGLILVMLMRRLGVENLCLVGGREGRLQLARELGAGLVLNYHHLRDSLAQGILRAAGEPFSVAVEASGSAGAVRASLDVVQTGGRIGVLGDYGMAQADFAWNLLLHREIELVGSNASAGAWDAAVRLAVQEELPLGRLISHRFTADQFMQDMQLTRSRDGQVVKVILEWESFT